MEKKQATSPTTPIYSAPDHDGQSGVAECCAAKQLNDGNHHCSSLDEVSGWPTISKF